MASWLRCLAGACKELSQTSFSSLCFQTSLFRFSNLILMHFCFSNLIQFWISNLIHRCTFGFQTSFIDALWGFKPRSSMHFWVSNLIHRCTFGFQTSFIDALLGFKPHSSMHFWVSNLIHRCTFGFQTLFINALSGFKPHSSMHFGVANWGHQWTLALWRPETVTIDALGLLGGSDRQSSMDSRAPRRLMNGGSEFALTTFGRPAVAAPIIIPGGSVVNV